MHLAEMFKVIAEFRPAVVVVDPITSLLVAGTTSDAKGMVTRLIDHLKTACITSLFTNLTHGGHPIQQSEIAMSSLMDTWLLLQDLFDNGDRHRVLYVLKARGIPHSNQVREFVISNRGINVIDSWVGPNGVPASAAREATSPFQEDDLSRRRRELTDRCSLIERQLAGLRSLGETENAEWGRMKEPTVAMNTNRNSPARRRPAGRESPRENRSRSRNRK
jgi:circadian clock protein KaiC